MAKLSGRRFKEVAKVAALDDGGGRYLVALRSDGTILKRRTTEPADASYHAWKKLGTFQATEAGLRALIEENGLHIEETRAERVRREARSRDTQVRQEARAERMTRVDSDWRAILPHECWACRAEAEQSPGFISRLFRIMAEEGETAARKYVDERLVIVHKSHKRSWV